MLNSIDIVFFTEFVYLFCIPYIPAKLLAAIGVTFINAINYLSLLLSSLRACYHFSKGTKCENTALNMPKENVVITYRFFMASLRPIFRAVLTISERLTLPICLRFIFDGLGSLSIQSGTEDPDCNKTLAMLIAESGQI